MLKFLGKALAGLVLTKDARKVVGEKVTAGLKGQRPALPGGGETPGPVSERDAAIARIEVQAQEVVTTDRAELIRQAMKVRAAKQTILADLDDDSRAKLVATALKALLNESPKKE